MPNQVFYQRALQDANTQKEFDLKEIASWSEARLAELDKPGMSAADVKAKKALIAVTCETMSFRVNNLATMKHLKAFMEMQIDDELPGKLPEHDKGQVKKYLKDLNEYISKGEAVVVASLPYGNSLTEQMEKICQSSKAPAFKEMTNATRNLSHSFGDMREVFKRRQESGKMSYLLGQSESPAERLAREEGLKEVFKNSDASFIFNERGILAAQAVPREDMLAREAVKSYQHPDNLGRSVVLDENLKLAYQRALAYSFEVNQGKEVPIGSTAHRPLPEGLSGSLPVLPPSPTPRPQEAGAPPPPPPRPQEAPPTPPTPQEAAPPIPPKRGRVQKQEEKAPGVESERKPIAHFKIINQNQRVAAEPPKATVISKEQESVSPK